MINRDHELRLKFKYSKENNNKMRSVEWKISNNLVSYPSAIQRMEKRVIDIANNKASELVWLLEHPPLYTAGTSAKLKDLLKSKHLPVYTTGRGGQYTYHGPGQRIAYVMLDLSKRIPDIRHYIYVLEQWVINTLSHFSIIGKRSKNRVGVWIERPEKPKLPNGNIHEDKIAAIGVRIQKWISWHGMSLNVNPYLEHYKGIVPCGVEGHGITSIADLGITASIADIDLALKQEFENLF